MSEHSSAVTADLQSVYDALVQAQDCIRGATPEDMTFKEAEEDTISKVRDAMRAVEAMQTSAKNDDVKLSYVKRWRTIVKLPAKYADEIVEALRSSIPAQLQPTCDTEMAFIEACDEAGCAYDNEALLKAIADLKVAAQGPLIPAAWQYRVMFDATHQRRDEWCPWRDAGEKYFNKVNAEIAAGATRVQTRILYALSDTTAFPSPERAIPHGD